MRVRVETRKRRLTARSAAQFLNALLLLRDGLAIAFLGESAELLKLALPGNGAVISALSEMGSTFVAGAGWREVSWENRAWLSYAVGQHAVATGEMELELLENGSLVGVIKEIIKGIERMIHNALSAANDLLPGNDGWDFANALRGILHATNASSETLSLAAGMCLIAARDLRTAFESMDAESIGVEVDVEVGAGV
jgi:hypothetical protein